MLVFWRKRADFVNVIIYESMEIKNGKKYTVGGRAICFAAGILSCICGVYWLVRALFYDDSNLPALLGSVVIGLFLTLYGSKR